MLGAGGVFQTDDGLIIAGEPDGAASWFPVNDHPLDKASYTFNVTVPKGLEVVSNGFLQHRKTHQGLTTFTWQEKDPMNSYLATMGIGKFEITRYKQDGLRFYDAIDPALFEPVAAPTTGTHFMLSNAADSSYKRLMRTLTVPAGGATLSFVVTRDTEQPWDFMFVEAHTVGLDDWTTLPDVNGHTSSDVGNSCPFESWELLHPFLVHYQTDHLDGTCSPTGTTGVWWAATGASNGPEQWTVDLAAYAGKQVELSISYASDDVVQTHGLFVDDITTSTGEGNTSFEDDGDTLDGWTVPGAPAGSPGNTNDWTVGTAADVPPNFGFVARNSFAREPEIIKFLSDNFGPYPFRDVGGIVDHLPGVGFALENQTRPIYAQEFFYDQVGADDVVVHELAHQWYGDSVSVHFWQDIWLNEGFATYAEWLWSEHEGTDTPQQIFDATVAGIPADDPFWQLVIGDPGPDHLFDQPIYVRGAMTLQVLRNDRRGRCVLPHPAQVGEQPPRWQREHGRVHQAGRAHLGPGSHSALRHLAVHRRQAGRARSGGRDCAHRPGDDECVRCRTGCARRAARHPRAQALTTHPSRRAGSRAASQRPSTMPSATASPLPRLWVTPREPWPVASTRPATPG